MLKLTPLLNVVPSPAFSASLPTLTASISVRTSCQTAGSFTVFKYVAASKRLTIVPFTNGSPPALSATLDARVITSASNIHIAKGPNKAFISLYSPLESFL